MSRFKVKTKQEEMKDRLEKGERFSSIILSLGWGNLKYFPEYGDQSEVYRRALKDFSRNDFSEAGPYIDSLVQIADFYQGLMQEYLAELESIGYMFDEHGTPLLPEVKGG